MKLTVQHVFTATPILTAIINEKRPLPLKGAYRVARMHAKLVAEFQTIAEKRDAMIVAYNHEVWVDEKGVQFPSEAVAMVNANARKVPAVPPDRAEEFFAAWAALGAEEIDVNVDPIPLSQINLGDDVAGSITAAELIGLGDLVRDDSDERASTPMPKAA